MLGRKRAIKCRVYTYIACRQASATVPAARVHIPSYWPRRIMGEVIKFRSVRKPKWDAGPRDRERERDQEKEALGGK